MIQIRKELENNIPDTSGLVKKTDLLNSLNKKKIQMLVV